MFLSLFLLNEFKIKKIDLYNIIENEILPVIVKNERFLGSVHL